MHAETEIQTSSEHGDAKFTIGNHALSVDYERELFTKNDWKVTGDLGFTYAFDEGTSNKASLNITSAAYYGVTAFYNVSINSPPNFI